MRAARAGQQSPLQLKLDVATSSTVVSWDMEFDRARREPAAQSSSFDRPLDQKSSLATASYSWPRASRSDTDGAVSTFSGGAQFYRPETTSTAAHSFSAAERFPLTVANAAFDGDLEPARADSLVRTRHATWRHRSRTASHSVTHAPLVPGVPGG